MTDKMIEEIKQIINVRCEAELEQVHASSMNGKVTKTVDTSLIAKDIYNAGYRKIPEGSVVLDKQEHQNYCAYKIIEPQIRGCLDRERELEKQVAELEEQRDRQAYIAEELIQEKHRRTEQARKETAEKFVALLTDNGERQTLSIEDNKGKVIDKAYIIPKSHLIQVAKQFGVEVEE